MSHKAERQVNERLREHGLSVRAAGSLGFVDNVFGIGPVTVFMEIKATSRTLTDGTYYVDLTESGGDGLEQRDRLLEEDEKHGSVATWFGFVVRRKGQLNEDQERFTWHPIRGLEEATQIRPADGIALAEMARMARERSVMVSAVLEREVAAPVYPSGG